MDLINTLTVPIVCLKITVKHVLTVMNKYTHTCERGAIEREERRNVHDNFIYICAFSQEKK